MLVGMSSFDGHGYTYQCDRRSSNLDQVNGVLPTVQALGERMYQSINLAQASTSGNSDIYNSHPIHLEATDHEKNDPRDYGIFHGQRLSLTLGTHFPPEHLITSVNYGQADETANLVDRSYAISRNDPGEVQSLVYGSRTTGNEYTYRLTSNESASFTSVLWYSRYLRPTQELLEDIVSVRKGIDLNEDRLVTKEVRRIQNPKGERSASYQKQSSQSASHFFSEKHDIQDKVSKLNVLLDELDSRYEQYCHQMEELVSSFDMVAGPGAAKSYTVLALQAMSRHFATLRNSIIVQIRLARRSLTEDLSKSGGGLARLSLVDQNSRQKRTTIHQLGMFNIQQAWRPIRGLPESSVVILRAWLFEHFLHPYPNEREKLMLASQTGLTRNQVTNWFINARVRLWKPMIEEMYREEFADVAMDSDPSDEAQP